MPNLVKQVIETKLSPHVGPTRCCYKLYTVNGPLVRRVADGTAASVKMLKLRIQGLLNMDTDIKLSEISGSSERTRQNPTKNN